MWADYKSARAEATYFEKIIMKNLFCFVLFLVMFSACQSKLRNKFVFKQEFIDSIQYYIDIDSGNHSSYLLLSADGIIHHGNVHNGFLIGPMYNNIHPSYKESDYLELIEYNKKKVYLYLPFAQFLIIPNKHASKIDYCKQDSVLYYKTEYSHNPIINYLKRASLLYYSGERLFINESIDSLFLPKIE